jgi:dolichyl-phosphate-mannose-protein mannosyltransferase
MRIIATQNSLNRILHWPFFVLTVLVLFTLVIHFSVIMQPDTYLFDETYYIADAHSILANQGTLLPEHPPLGKLFIVEGIRLFGDNPFGWRFFSVIFGTISIILLYFICRRLKLSQMTSNLVVYLFSLENLSFIQASVGMLDVYCLTFMLACLLFYLRGNFLLAGLFGGMAALAKLTGISVFGVIFLYWLISDRKNWRLMSITIAVSITTFLVLMPLIEFTITSEWFNPAQRIFNILNYAGGLTNTNVTNFSASTPLDWLMNKGIIFYNNSPQYIAAVSFTITPFILPVVLYFFYQSLKKQPSALIGLLWFACNYLPWVVASVTIHRFTYIYYMYPVIIGLCIGLGIAIAQIVEYVKSSSTRWIYILGKALVSGYLVVYLAVFVILSPLAPSVIGWIF